KLFPPRHAYRLVSRAPGFNAGAGGGRGGGRGGRGGAAGRGAGAEDAGAVGADRSTAAPIRSMEPGAYLQYHLKEAGPVTFAITGADGRQVRTLRANGQKGMNTITWDLRYDLRPKAVELRTTPSTYPQIWDEPRF